MTVRNRLSLQFTLISGIILSGIFVVIYFLSARFMKYYFYNLLKERAYITAQVFLERDELAVRKFMDIQQKYLESIPGETLNIYDENNQPVFLEESKYNWPPSLVNMVRAKGEYRFTFKDKPGLGIYYKDNQGNFVVIAVARNKYGKAQLNNLAWILFTLFILGLLIIFFSSRWYARKALQPIKDVNRQVKDIRANNLHLRVARGKNQDEMDELARNFNDLLERLEIAFARQQSFVNNASHELRTPLTTIIGEIEVSLQKERNPQEYVQTLRSVLDESEKLHRISNGLLMLAQTDWWDLPGNMQFLRLDELLAELKENRTKEETLHLTIAPINHPEKVYTLFGNRELLKLAIENIIKNGFKYSHNQPVNVELIYKNEQLLLTVSDQGIGIPEKDLENIFMPLFRGENARTYKGYGIGLPLSEKIIQFHKGKILVKSIVEKGTHFTIIFPISL